MSDPTHAPARLALVALVAAIGLAACRTPSLGVYRMDVQQGNVVTQDMVDRLEPGMDKRKVRYVLGTPLVEDSFNPDRWDYYYSFQDRRKDRTHRRVTLFFVDERLARIEGDVDAAPTRRPVEIEPERVVVVPERQDDGLLAALTPPFLRRDKREDSLEQSRPELEEQATGSAAESAPAEGEAVATVSPPAEAVGPAPGTPQAREATEEADYFRRVFRGFGRPDPAADLIPQLPAPPAEEDAPEPAPAPTDALPEPEGVTADAEDAAPESTEKEKGFFSGLVDKLRRERGEEPTEDPAAPADQQGEDYLEESGSED